VSVCVCVYVCVCVCVCVCVFEESGRQQCVGHAKAHATRNATLAVCGSFGNDIKCMRAPLNGSYDKCVRAVLTVCQRAKSNAVDSRNE
jgi:hypothetical protein